MADLANLKIEFRIPISPTPGFYAQVRVFDFALRRLGPPYRQAKLSVFVGDNCDIEAVRRVNAWSSSLVDWHAVPTSVFDEFGIHGTADWRLVPPAGDADLIVLSDADTMLLRDIDPLLAMMPTDRPAVRGHMAHGPPPSSGGGLPNIGDAGYWPQLFERFGAPWPRRLFNYSIDETGRYPQAPPYFNLGFVALNPLGLAELGSRIFEFQRAFTKVIDSHMRCQIAVSVIAHQQGFDIDVLPATYNTANDMGHLKSNYISISDIRVLHYLRTEEVDRSDIFLDSDIEAFIGRDLSNPVNRLLQSVAKDYLAWRSREEEG